MAEMHGKDLHIACEEMVEKRDGKDVPVPDVYGTDSEFTPTIAIAAFKSRHKANHAPAPTPKVLTAVVGREAE